MRSVLRSFGYAVKAMIPEEDGVENIQVDTIHGVLKYKRPGPDTNHKSNACAPPSALRRIDLILVDEASQYDDREWERFSINPCRGNLIDPWSSLSLISSSCNQLTWRRHNACVRFGVKTKRK